MLREIDPDVEKKIAEMEKVFQEHNKKMATFGSRNPLNNTRKDRWNDSLFLPPKKVSLSTELLVNKQKHNIEENLDNIKKEIIGQDSVVNEIIENVKNIKYRDLELVDGRDFRKGTLGNYFLAGPTGVGKTETVLQIAKAIHGSTRNVLRIDCGEYHSDHEVAKLIGAPPGYLGHRETQALLTQARISSVTSENANISIVLFDEVEKAPNSLQKLLLGVLDRGELRLGDNNIVSFANCIVFFSSNIGMKELQGKEFNFISGEKEKAKVSYNDLFSAAKKKFSPEFIGRLDGFFVFNRIDEHLKDITITVLDKIFYNFTCSLLNRMTEFDISIDEKLVEKLKTDCDFHTYGARNIRKYLQKNVYLALLKYLESLGYIVSSNLCSGFAKSFCGKKVEVKVLCENNNISFSVEVADLPEEAMAV